MKFAHIADSHLGGWRQPELQKINLESFKKAIDIALEEHVEFILFAGDLFDSPFPPIEVLRDTFAEFKRLKDANIKAYIIAGSHDYSVSGKTFLDVLEKSGFCEICKFIEDKEKNEITLIPSLNQSCYIYGYPGKKSGMEVADLRKIKINEPYADHFRILMLHTTIKEAAEHLPLEEIDAISLEELPKADYYALGHLHINFEKEANGKPAIYGGPTFPNNFKELEDLQGGCLYIIDVQGYTKITKKEIKLKDVEVIKIELEDSLLGTEKIIDELKKRELTDKIVLLKIYGNLKTGKTSDIKFQEIQEYLEKTGAYCFLKNTSGLEIEKNDIGFKIEYHDMEKIEEVLIKKYEKENQSNFNNLIFPLIETLNIEKHEGETSIIFESRIFSELKKILKVEL